MQTPPFISIALCTFNGERFLRPQLDSLLAQDHPTLEVVAVDDGSRDGTMAILEEYAARDSRLRVFRNPENLGFRRNFERAMGLCKGELVAPSDQDDVWRSDKLSLMSATLGDAAAIYCDSELVDTAGRPLGKRLSQMLPLGPVHDPAAFLFDNCVSGHALLFRRALLERALPVPEGVFHDWWLAFVAAGAGGVAYHPEPLVRYRQHADSVTDIAHLRGNRGRRLPRGHALTRIEAEERRLRACATLLGGRGDGLIDRTVALWLERKDRYFCPRLACFMVRNRHRLFANKPDARLRRLREAMKLVWGLRLKRLVQPHDYGRASRA
jgi:glycosyltransferase involved in cell wall biosynthesis